MLIVVTIFLLLGVPLAMVLFNLARPRFVIQGFMVVLAVIAGWILVLLARSDIPQTITLLDWEPASFFPNSPSLVLDQFSWSFALALMSLTTGLTFTSIAQLGQSPKVVPPINNPVINIEEPPDIVETGSDPGIALPQKEAGLSASWRAWAGMLVMTSFGLVAVTAGNMLTLVLGWAAVDVIELVILLSHVRESKPRERIVLAFTARMAGTGMALLAGIIPWSQGISLSFDSINQSTSIYLILAAGLRLGVLPIHQPVFQEIPLRRGLKTVLRLVPAASSFILLVRVAHVGVLGPATPYLLGLTALAGLYAGINWINAKNELEGRSFWLLGTSTLAIASAILNHPGACLAWSTASILGGGLLFSMSIRHKNILPFVVIGILSFTGLPFSPTWRGMNLYEYTSAISTAISSLVFYILAFFYLSIHSSLLIGYTRHILRGIYPPERQAVEHVERWVWLLYPIALTFILVTNLLIGMLNQPRLAEASAIMWGMGAATIGVSIMFGYFLTRYLGVPFAIDQVRRADMRSSAFSLSWVYRFLWRIFRVLTRITSLVSAILEGDGGILWALVLFALIFVFLQR